MKKVAYCSNHSKYLSGCEDCLKQSRMYRGLKTERDDTTHYKNGLPKKQGIYSEENWARFNALGKILTNKKDT